MRHKYSGRKLNRTSSHRTAMFKNMMASLIEHEEIKTTVPKAKELRGFVERLITISKTDTVAKRRIVFSRIRSKEAVTKLFNELGNKSIEELQDLYERMLPVTMFNQIHILDLQEKLLEEIIKKNIIFKRLG